MSHMKRHLENLVPQSQYLDLIREGLDPAAIVNYADCFSEGGWAEFFKHQDEVNRNFILKTFPLIEWEDLDDFPYEVTITGDNVEVEWVG